MFYTIYNIHTVHNFAVVLRIHRRCDDDIMSIIRWCNLGRVLGKCTSNYDSFAEKDM